MIYIKSNNFLLWGGIILVVVLVGYYLLKGQSAYNAPQSQPENTQSNSQVSPAVSATTSGQTMAKITVDYTNSGFTPKSITVKVGDSVTWGNKSTKSMWVASAVHPTHQELPGFDQLAGVEANGEYTYTFSKAGNWKYHNHLGPSDTGVVIVQ